MSLPLLALIGMLGVLIFYGYKTSRKYPEASMSSCLLDKMLIPIYNLFSTYYSNSGLIVEEVRKNSIICNTVNPELFAIQLEGFDNVDNFLSLGKIEDIFRDFNKNKDSYIYYVQLKRGKYQRQYIFCHNELLIKSIADFYKTDLMSGNEIANTLLDTYLQNSYISNNKHLERSIFVDFLNKDAIEPVYMLFRRVTKTLLFKSLKETRVYQGYKRIDGITATNIQAIFQSNLDGAIWSYIDFNHDRVKTRISKIITASNWIGKKKDFKDIKTAHDSGTNLALINSVIFLKEPNDEVVGNISNFLKNAYLPQLLFRREHIQKTPLKYRDTEFDFLVDLEYLDNYISTVHKKQPTNVDVFGLDKNKAYTGYSFSEENFNPFSVVIASAGSGKSVAKQKIMSQLIDLDYSTAEASNLGSKGVKIRAFDIGYSDKNFVDFVKSNKKNNIIQLESGLNSFRYNIVNINMENDADTIEADILFSCDLISTIRQTQGQVALTQSQASCYKEILRTIYKTEEYEKYKVKSIMQTHPATFSRLLELGYKTSSNLRDIKEQEYSFLRVPTLKDIANFARIKKADEQLLDQEKKVYEEVSVICSEIAQEPIFNTFDNVQIDEADFISMELNEFKDSRLFTPIFLCIFQKTYLRDRAYSLWCKDNKKKAPKLFYAIEEARNFFIIPHFQEVLTKVVREARKYNLHIFFVVQNAEDVPKGILNNIDTKIFLLAPNKKEEVIEAVKSNFAPPDNVVTALRNTEKFEMCIWYSAGVFNLSFEMSDKELELFNTNPNLVKAV